MDRNLALEVVRVTEAAALAASRLMGRGDEKAADKVAVGPDLPEGVVDIDNKPEVNLKNLAKAKQRDIRDLVVCILDRPRHSELIAAVRSTGARIMLISDGDVSGVIATAQKGSGVDMYVGSGGAPEGVLAAAALRCIGGQMQGRLLFRNDDEKARAKKWGVTDLNRKYSMLDLAHGDVMFAATGVTDGPMLKGVRRGTTRASTHSIVMRSKTGTVRIIEANHNWDLKMPYEARGAY